MKKIGKTALVLLLTACMALSCALTVGAVRAPLPIGDADGNGNVDILDVTRIQRWLADLDDMTPLQQYVADVNNDGIPDILDATRIQRKLADLDSGFYAAYYGSYWIEDWRFYADYDSGKARVGTPVTFCAEAFGQDWSGQEDSFTGGLDTARADLPFTYAFFVNDELVQERSENNELIYTFTEAGSYRVQAVMYNALDEKATAILSSYRVVEPYPLDQPVIVSTLFKKDTHNEQGYDSPLTVRAEGGEGPYQYMYTAWGIYDGHEKDGLYLEEPIDDSSVPVLTTFYLDSDTFTIPRGLYRNDSAYYSPEAALIVYVRDSKGNVSDPVTVYHRICRLIG